MTKRITVNSIDTMAAVAHYLEAVGWELAANLKPTGWGFWTYTKATSFQLGLDMERKFACWYHHNNPTELTFNSVVEFIDWLDPQAPRVAGYEVSLKPTGLQVGCTAVTWIEYDKLVKWVEKNRTPAL
jgi:hypothetical protein